MEAELGDLNECVDRKTMVNIIHEIASLIIDKKGSKGYKDSFYLSKSSEKSDSIETFVIRKQKAISYK